MRTTLAWSTFVLSTVPALAQNPPIDLGSWTSEHLNGAGPWGVDAQRLYAQSVNTASSDCSVLYSDFDVTLLDFRITVDPLGGDDDLMGFVLGWNPGDSFNTTADYLLVDWKRLTQSYQNWGTAQVGLALSRMTGTFTPGFAQAPIDLWSHTLNCTELQRGATFGQTGWSFATAYNFRVLYTPTSVDVWLNNVHEFSITGTFTTGRFGCYNFSQSRTDFQFPLQGSFTNYGIACPGSGGTPYLFSPVDPYVGEGLPIIVANLDPAAFAFVVIGLSDNAWLGTPLPAGLGSYGAPGCTLYSSAEILLAATNFNGTAHLNFAVPASLPPSTTPLFFTQSLIFDPAANPLGVALSNAAAVAVGIR